MIVWAPAKINLFLEVTGQRRDGYHTLETIFQALDIHDTLVLAKTSGPLECVSNLPGVPPEKNLSFKAAALFLARGSRPWGVRIQLRKKIPLGGGLGGGSSDAAAVLWGLARWEKRTPRELSRLAARLGADVPFFLTGGTCLARGIGEKITPLRARPFWVVLVNPGFPVATAGVFQSLHKPLTNRCKVNKIRTLLERGAPPEAWAPWLYNRLEEVVLPRYPEIRRIKKMLLDQGALGSLLTGSGATVFGIVSSRREGLKIKRILEKKSRWKIWLAQSVQTGITIQRT